MSQAPIVIPNTGTLSGLDLVNNTNAALATLDSAWLGTVAPTHSNGRRWFDSSVSNRLIEKISDGTDWLLTGLVLDTSANLSYRRIGGGHNNIASASTCDLGSMNESGLTITGTTTITSFGSSAAVGELKAVTLGGALTLTYNATSLILPGAADINGGAGDSFIAEYLGSGNWKVLFYTSASGSSTIDNSIQDFRLSLTTGVPVTTSDVTAATTLYCTPYKGNRIALQTAGVWALFTSAQFSIALGTLISGRPYDVFCYNNAGPPALELLAWTSTSARATALAYQDGVLVKSGDSTRRYLGTFQTTTTTTTEDSVANRYLWNYYNRVARPMVRRESAVSWTYSSNAAFRQANANTANQLNFVVGVAEDSVSATYMAQASNGDATNRIMRIAIGLNSTTGVGNSVACAAQNNNTYMGGSGLVANIDTLPAVGVNYLAMLELGAGAGTQTWYGTGSYATLGIVGKVLA